MQKLPGENNELTSGHQRQKQQQRQQHQSKQQIAEEAPPKLEYETNLSLDKEIPIQLFKLIRKIKCLPLLEPKILDDKLRKLKHKRRDIRRTAKRLLR